MPAESQVLKVLSNVLSKTVKQTKQNTVTFPLYGHFTERTFAL